MATSLLAPLLADWQALVSLGIGVAALAYVGRRWWPALRRLLKPSAPLGQAPCGQPHEAPGLATAGDQIAAPACGSGSGCGHCGQGQHTPTKDHRVHIVRHGTR